jgi:hypothetical protein
MSVQVICGCIFTPPELVGLWLGSVGIQQAIYSAYEFVTCYDRCMYMNKLISLYQCVQDIWKWRIERDRSLHIFNSQFKKKKKKKIYINPVLETIHMWCESM